MSSTQILQAKKSNGVSFHFKFPKTGLSLRSVVIEDDGLPKLIFDGANCRELPTLTEEDFATVARVVAEGKRPEFFYNLFLNPSHPFSNFGRWYKQYSPQWLRGTSIGELLSEADWLMKCLHVGTRSNESKTEFWSWQKTSKLDNLAVHMDFPCESGKSGSVLMGCDSVKMEQSDNEILFVGEPKMKITDESSPMYSKYITEYYDNVAYYDEPLFLKMQELIKLIVAIEWMMKEKGIVFNKKWLSYHTEKNKLLQSQALQPIEVENTDEIFQHVIDSFKTKMKELHGVDPYSPVSLAKVELTKRTLTGIELTGTRKCPLSSLEEVIRMRISFNDYNFLYEWFDCRKPFTFNADRKPIIPDVTSWSELYAETVPVPCMIGVLHDNAGIFTKTGGITTTNIPKKKVVAEKSATQKKVAVKATKKIVSHPEEIKDIPQRSSRRKPNTNIPPNTPEAKLNQIGMSDVTITHGTCSSEHSLKQSNNGSGIQKQPAVKVAVIKQTKIDKKTVNEKTFSGIVPIPDVTPSTALPLRNKKSRSQPPPNKPISPPPLSQTASGNTVSIEQNTAPNSPPTSTGNGTENIGQQPQLELQQPSQNVPANTPISPPWSPTSTDSGLGNIGQQNPPQLELQPQNVPANTPISPPWSPTSTDSGFGDIGQQYPPQLELQPQNVHANTHADSPPLSPDSGLGLDEPIEEQYSALDDIILGPKTQSDSSDKDDNSDNKDMD